MILNKTRLLREAARGEGFELDHVHVTDVKPVNIYISKNLDTCVKENISKGLESLKMVSVNFT